MSDQTEGLVRYVVQRFSPGAGEEEMTWRDIAKPIVSPRTRRRTILEQALGERPMAGIYRVLDAESANDIEVKLEDQPPKVVIG